MVTYWISFVGNDGPLGCCIVDGHDVEDVIYKTHLLKINPGGEALVIPFDLNDPEAVAEIKKWGKDRLMLPEELLNKGAQKVSDHPRGDELAKFIKNDPSVNFVCENHNKRL